MFADEFSKNEQEILLKFFNDKKTLIVNDILKGRGRFSAEWMLVILKLKDTANMLQFKINPAELICQKSD